MSLSTVGYRVAALGATFALTAAAAGGAQAAASGARATAGHRTVIHGTVVHVNRRARSFVVATRGGRLYAIHATHRPRTARAVTVGIRPLRNGTYAASWVHVSRVQRHARVRVRGIVTHIDARHSTFVLSSRGVSMLIHTSGGAAHMAHAANALPPVATVVTTTGEVNDQGDVNEQSLQVDGTDTGAIDLEGTILAVDPTTRTLTISSSDDDQSAATTTVNVPTTLDISMFSTGQEVELSATANPDGTYTLVGSADDQGVQGANDQGDQQGEQCDGTDFGAVDLQGTIQAVDPTTRTLTISSSDDDQSAATTTVNVPTTLDISTFSAGQEIELTATANPDGTYTLVGSPDSGGDNQQTGDQAGGQD